MRGTFPAAPYDSEGLVLVHRLLASGIWRESGVENALSRSISSHVGIHRKFAPTGQSPIQRPCCRPRGLTCRRGRTLGAGALDCLHPKSSVGMDRQAGRASRPAGPGTSKHQTAVKRLEMRLASPPLPSARYAAAEQAAHRASLFSGRGYFRGAASDRWPPTPGFTRPEPSHNQTLTRGGDRRGGVGGGRGRVPVSSNQIRQSDRAAATVWSRSAVGRRSRWAVGWCDCDGLGKRDSRASIRQVSAASPLSSSSTMLFLRLSQMPLRSPPPPPPPPHPQCMLVAALSALPRPLRLQQTIKQGAVKAGGAASKVGQDTGEGKQRGVPAQEGKALGVLCCARSR